jgi:GH15 family glucan-1,4-alpha-glucosidase
VWREERLDTWHAALLSALGNEVCERWREPDEGIWEVRSGRHHHTFSKAMCCVALERLVALHEAGYLRVDADRYRDEAETIRAAVEEHGYNEAMDSYVATFGGDRVDASLLLLPFYGYVEATAPRMKSTFARHHEELAQDGLLYRYPPGTDDGLSSEEGAFGICSFWDEEMFARLGRLEEAQENLDQTLAYANDLGLFAEEIDPETGGFLGNFPQAFTHVGLINAAVTLQKARDGTLDALDEPMEPAHP